MRTASANEVGGRETRPELTDYLDADGKIVLPDGVTLVTFLDRHIANIGDAIAYRYLDSPSIPTVRPSAAPGPSWAPGCGRSVLASSR